MIIGTGGFFLDYKGFSAFVEGATTESSVFTDVKVRQYGTTGIATGIWAHSHRSKKNGSVAAYKEFFTYVFTEQHGKWVWVSAQHSEGPTDVAVEEAAIKSVVEKETQAFLDRDAETVANYRANVDYATMLVRHGGGVAFTKNTKKEGLQDIKAWMVPLGKSDGSTFKNTDYVIHIKDNTAFVTFDQTVTAVDGAKSFFHEVRYLEKINLKWLIVYVGAVVFEPGH